MVLENVRIIQTSLNILKTLHDVFSAKIDSTDIIPFPMFTAIQQPRKQTNTIRSDVIVVYAKEKFS